MGYESIADEGERNNCFSKIQPVGQKKNIETKHLSQDKAFLTPKDYKYGGRFSLLVGYNI